MATSPPTLLDVNFSTLMRRRVCTKSTFKRLEASRRAREHRSPVAKQSQAQRAEASSGSVANSNAEGILQGLNSSPDLRPFAAICVTACLSLLFVEFAGRPVAFQYFLPSYGTRFDSYWVLRQKTWWIGCTILGYVALPTIAMLLLPGRRLRECNFSWRGFVDHSRIYAGLYLLVLPAIWLVSLRADFYTFYPMYGQAGRSWFDLLAWEGMYLAQFIALEFFFRGFLVGGLSKHIGVLAVPVSVMPYMMIHFTKLWPEAMASIVAGLVLGYLAWRTKSIWGGVCVHCAVAMTMDLLALAHKGQLPWLHG